MILECGRNSRCLSMISLILSEIVWTLTIPIDSGMPIPSTILIYTKKTPRGGFSVHFRNLHIDRQRIPVVAPLLIPRLTICWCGGLLLRTTWLKCVCNRFRSMLLRVFCMRKELNHRLQGPTESCWKRFDEVALMLRLLITLVLYMKKAPRGGCLCHLFEWHIQEAEVLFNLWKINPDVVHEWGCLF